MGDTVDGTGASLNDAGSNEGSTQQADGTVQPDELALARKRQAGAEAARQAAETRAKELADKLAQYEQANQTAAQKDMTELAQAQARAEAAEKRAAEAETKATARLLDARFPNARKELPDLTDEVKLAKFEAMMSDSPEPPTPLQHSENRTGTGTKKEKDVTAADAKAQLLALPPAI